MDVLIKNVFENYLLESIKSQMDRCMKKERKAFKCSYLKLGLFKLKIKNQNTAIYEICIKHVYRFVLNGELNLHHEQSPNCW